MNVSLATSIHLDHGRFLLDAMPGAQPPMQSFVPVGLLSLKATADRADCGFDTRATEINGLINSGRITNDDRFYENIADEILRDDDDIVGLMTDADSLVHTISTARRIKARAPNVLMCLGGPAASPIASLILEKFSFIDCVVRGEAELSFVELLQSHMSHQTPANVLGLTWRDGNHVVNNLARPVIENLDDLPIPAFDAFDMASGAPLYLDVGRGCPFKCRFCATAPFWNRKYRMKSIDRIVKELELVRDKYGRTHVNFSHDIFTCDRSWTLRFCNQLIERRIGVEWTCSTRTDIIDPELLERMATARCVEIYYGIETGSPDTQKFIDKGLDLSWAKRIVADTVTVGIRPITGFIVGHPNETISSLQNTLDYFFELLNIGKARSHLFTLCPFQEAPMYPEYSRSIDRRAEYADVPLLQSLDAEREALIVGHRDVFASGYRYGTPNLASSLVDASEELSCHLVILKSLWPHLLPHYESVIEWYRRWVDWIEADNRVQRPNSRLFHQGNAFELLRFAQAELIRLGVQDRGVADLVLYEKTKLEAKGFDAPNLSHFNPDTLNLSTRIAPRCKYAAVLFRHPIADLLAGRTVDRLPPGQDFWVAFAKTGADYVDTLQLGRAAKIMLEIVHQPQTVREVLKKAAELEQIPLESGWRAIEQLCKLGLLHGGNK